VARLAIGKQQAVIVQFRRNANRYAQPDRAGGLDTSGKGDAMKPLVNFKVAWRIAVLALLLPISSVFAAQTPDSASISKLLDQARIHAAQADDDAALLDSYTRSGLTWQSHAKCLQDIKVHAVDLLADFAQLKAMREKGTPRQREAIDRLEPLLQSMALELTTTIQQLNQHQERVNMPSFRTRVHAECVAVSRVYTHLCECTNKNSKI
jgi:hypothetical protein